MRPRLSEEQIELLVYQFKIQTLTKEDWTHEAHLIVAIWFISRYDFFDAVCRIKSGIILLNTAFEGTNDGNSGYHETMTIFWAKVISLYKKIHPGFSVEELVNEFLNSPLAIKTLPFDFYDHEEMP